MRQESNLIKIGQLVLIALGSNEKSVFGDARETVQKAMAMIGQLSDQTAQFSSFYATPAFPAGSGPDFVNAAMAIITKSSAHELLAQLHQIEAAAGRVRTARWGQRTLDLDLIAYGDQVHPNTKSQTQWRDLTLHDQQQMTPKELILPHPRMQDRAFVLVPLMDVAADWRHPILGETVSQMCAALPAENRADVVDLGPFVTPLNTP